jgi:hypothetical protein
MLCIVHPIAVGHDSVVARSLLGINVRRCVVQAGTRRERRSSRSRDSRAETAREENRSD